MQRRVVLLVGLLLCLPAMAQAVTVSVPAGPNNRVATTGQQITLAITGADTMVSFDLDIQFPAGGPVITGIDMTSAGLLFAGEAAATLQNNNTVHVHGTVSSAGSHNSPGNIAIVTFDGTGKSGPYSLVISGNTGGSATSYGDADFNDTFPTTVDGIVTFPTVPEPSSIVLGLFAAAGLGAVMIRRNRARRAA